MYDVTVTDHGGGVWSTLTVKDDVIGLSRSHLVQGKNKHSGKSFSRFQKDSSTIVSWKQGRMKVYSNNPKAGFRDITTEAISHPATYLAGLDGAFRALRGDSTKSVIEKAYPLKSFVTPVNGVTPSLSLQDASTLTRALFGDKNYRKDLVRSVGGVMEYSPNDNAAVSLLTARGVAGLFPVDWLAAWIPMVARESSFSHNNVLPSCHLSAFRRMVKTMSDKQIRRLFTTDGNLSGLYDTVKMFTRIRENDADYVLADLSFQTFKELHDVLARDERRLKEPRFDISYKKTARKLPGEYDGYRIVAPLTNHDLIDWGTEMGNCISGYAYGAKNGSTALYAVYDDSGKMMGNLELNPKTGDIRQLLGKYNAEVDPNLKKTVHDAVSSLWPDANVTGGWQNFQNGWF